MPTKRTTMRSSKGTKLYAVRDKDGRFKDIQSYKKAHSMDIKRKSKAELAKAAKLKAAKIKTTKAKATKVKAKAKIVKGKISKAKAVSKPKAKVKAKKKK
jgi:hypothetical protein